MTDRQAGAEAQQDGGTRVDSKDLCTVLQAERDEARHRNTVLGTLNARMQREWKFLEEGYEAKLKELRVRVAELEAERAKAKKRKR